jgi:VWFA-related protein
MTKIPMLLLLIAAASVALAQETTIRLDVNLVVLNVTVYGKDGKIVPGLGKEAFQVYEDDVERPITLFHGEDAPVTVGILMDNSVSMKTKRSEVIAAALAFAHSSNSADQMFVIHFNERARFGLGIKPFTDSIPELETALSRYATGGSTALYDGIGMALSHFRRASIDRKVLIAISDGGDNSSKSALADMLRWARDSNVVFYCIGLFDDSDRDRNPSVLEQFAQSTGGKAFFPANVTDTTSICLQIAREIRAQYMLGFAGAQDGKYHRIRVTAKNALNELLEVQNRPGYKSTAPNVLDGDLRK